MRVRCARLGIPACIAVLMLLVQGLSAPATASSVRAPGYAVVRVPVEDPFNPDDDGDGIPDQDDPAPLDPTIPGKPPTPSATDLIEDSDGDGIPNGFDPDDDTDGIPDEKDPAPFDPAPQPAPTPTPATTERPATAPAGDTPREPTAPMGTEPPLVVALPVTGHAAQPGTELPLLAPALALITLGLLSWRGARRLRDR